MADTSFKFASERLNNFSRLLCAGKVLAQRLLNCSSPFLRSRYNRVAHIGDRNLIAWRMGGQA
jgi:hypothetical protein